MRHSVILYRCLCAFLLCVAFSAASGTEMAGSACVNDLDDVANFLPVNDSGADAAMHSHGAAIEAQLKLAQKEAAEAVDAEKCDWILRSYLQTWRPGHLSLAPWPWSPGAELSRQAKASSKLDPFSSSVTILSKKTVLLVFPTFYDNYAHDVANLLKKNRKTLESHPDWIIDVRKNNGGSDNTYQPLLPWLGSTEYVNRGVEWLSTPDNIRAQQSVCSAASETASCEAFVKPIVSALQAAPNGTFTLAEGAHAVSYDGPYVLEKRRPQHVTVLIDRGCGSSCEQFLLAVRQSQAVKLVGRPTGGELDVSNLRPHPLPSGTRAIYYATSRSLRLPDMPIDQIGVQPDILLSRPRDAAEEENEILRVQRWMEGGSLQ